MSRWISVLVALTLLAGTAACGQKTVSAQTWAKDICGTVRPWAARIETSVANAQKSAGDRATSPVSAKAEMQKVFGDAVKTTDEAIKGVDKAGVPDVKNGAKITKEFRGALVGARDAFAKAEKATEKASTKDKPAFNADLTRIGDQLGKDYLSAGKKISVTQSPELKKVFSNTSQCHR